MIIETNGKQGDASQLRPAVVFPSAVGASVPGETLLVVDDDPTLRNLEVEVLRSRGYNVMGAEGACEALRIAGEVEAIQLLITDFQMPVIDGLELTRRFRTAHPQTPVLMVSGSLPAVCDLIKGLERFAFLEKPFEIAELLRKVRSLLDVVVPLPRPKSSH